MKTITTPILQSMVETDLHFGIVCHRLGKYYCNVMRLNGQCTQRCENCKVHVRNIFERMNVTDPIRDPYGLLVWSAREEIADILEAGERPAKKQTNWLGERREVNIFEMYMERAL